jgi:hypothetical protein
MEIHRSPSENYGSIPFIESPSKSFILKNEEEVSDFSEILIVQSQSKYRPSIIEKNKNPYDVNFLNLHSEFQSILKKFETSSEEEKDNIRKIINVLSIFLECDKQIINKMFEYKPEALKFIFYFYHKGKPKEYTIRKERDKKFNFFEFMFQSYNKFLKNEYIVSNTVLEVNDIIYDITGMSQVEFDLRNKLTCNKLLYGLKSLCENSNYLILLINDEEFENQQFLFHVLSTYELNKETEIKEYILKEGETSEKLNIIFDEEINPSEYKMTILPELLLKLRRFNPSINVQSLWDYNYLLEDRNHDIHECKELYPQGKSNYTYISMNELFLNFNRILLLEKKKYEQQLNGKFIKCIRDDDILEFKSRWIYSFNVTSDNFDLTIGIHQSTPNCASPMISYLYAGLVILKSNMTILNFVDYLPLKDARQNFIKLKLSKGSYVVVPM